MAEQIVLDDNMRDKMLKYAVELIEEEELLKNNLTKMIEDNRFYNWYYGYTEIVIPYYVPNNYDGFNRLIFYLHTSATSGSV